MRDLTKRAWLSGFCSVPKYTLGMAMSADGTPYTFSTEHVPNAIIDSEMQNDYMISDIHHPCLVEVVHFSFHRTARWTLSLVTAFALCTAVTAAQHQPMLAVADTAQGAVNFYLAGGPRYTLKKTVPVAKPDC